MNTAHFVITTSAARAHSSHYCKYHNYGPTRPEDVKIVKIASISLLACLFLGAIIGAFQERNSYLGIGGGAFTGLMSGAALWAFGLLISMFLGMAGII